MRGVILAGGKGTRLLPATRVMNKHMVPILNRPMITYPLETLKVMGIVDILVVSGGEHIGAIAEFLGDGSEFGVSLTYRVQKEAGGIAQALALAEGFAAGEPIAVILGDNVFDNDKITEFDLSDRESAYVFLKAVKDPQRFGVYTTSGIVEKPKEPLTDLAVTGLYVYPADVFKVIPTLTPSARGELEITDVNNFYFKEERLRAHYLYNAFWSDAGTPESLYQVTRWAYEG